MNPADICRECASNETTQCMQELIDKVARLARKELVLSQKVQHLEEAGDRIVKLVNEVYAMCGGPCILQDAVKEWERAKEEAE